MCATPPKRASIASTGTSAINRSRRQPVADRAVVVVVAAASAGGGNNGPFVMPGEYRVTLVVNGKDVATKPVRVVGDTAIKWTDADRKTWHDTALAFHRLQEQANEAADAVTQLATQYQTLETMLKTATNVPADAKTAIEAVGKDLTGLRTRLGVPAPGQTQGAGGGGGGGGGGFGGGGAPNQTCGPAGTDEGPDHGHALRAERAADASADSGPRGSDARDRRDQHDDHDDQSLFDKAGASAFKPAAPKPVRAVGPTN